MSPRIFLSFHFQILNSSSPLNNYPEIQVNYGLAFLNSFLAHENYSDLHKNEITEYSSLNCVFIHHFFKFTHTAIILFHESSFLYVIPL